jgi:membrane protein implicated in regulation of membrane protease activity
MTGQERGARAAWRHNGLTIVFGLLLLLFVAGQAAWGLAGYNESARTAGLQQISLVTYVTSSSFAVDLVENWQSEYLQFVLYILLTVWLVQRGSSESKQPGQEGRETQEKQLLGRFARPDSPRWAQLDGWRRSVYSHSLVLVMGTVFVLSWLAQAVTGRVADNEERMRDLLDPVGFGEYIISPDFWSRTLQNWQSEMLAIGSMAVFAIYLRERGSPESKPVGMPHHVTTSDE